MDPGHFRDLVFGAEPAPRPGVGQARGGCAAHGLAAAGDRGKQMAGKDGSGAEVAETPGVEIRVVASGNGHQEIPLPRDKQAVLLTGIFILLMLGALFFARSVVVPIVFAFVLNLMLQPVVRWMTAVYVPRGIAAALAIVLLFGAIVGLGYTLSGPAADWVSKAPQSLPRLQQRLAVIMEPIEEIKKVEEQVDKIAAGSEAKAPVVTVKGPSLSGMLFDGTRNLVAGLLTTAVLLFFLLVAGDMFLRRLVEILPRLRNKKQAVDISREIASNISKYLLTTTLINACVGIATGVAMYFVGLSDPILWGTLAFLLQYIPTLGPLVFIGVMFLAGLFSFDPMWQILLPPGVFLVINLVEEMITPAVLARRFTLNPVIVIIALMFWYWMWGVGGALLAVPMLVIMKIVCDRISPLRAFGHFLGAEGTELRSPQVSPAPT